MSDTHAQTARFVRESMLPEREPPLAEVGAVKWVRENLFSGWLNILLTVVSAVVIGWILLHIVPWFWNSVWKAGSLSQCREIRDEAFGPGASSACFAVITDRWHQLVFGFYPQTLYWRPVTALIVFLIAASPVLFPRLPRQALWFSAISPFIMFWLLWGGSVWAPLSVLLGIVLAYVAFRIASRFVSPVLAMLAGVAVAVLCWGLLAGPLTTDMSRILPIRLRAVGSDDFGGFMLSFIIGVSAIILSLPLGILLALGRQSDLFFINKVSVAFIELIRGVPLIVWLFTASLLLNYFLPPGTNFDLMLRVIIMVTLFSAAYIAEVVRGGLAALPKGQYEGADSLGLDYWQSMRLIILPQALKISIPGIVNTFIGLFKDTTLVVFIGLLDPIGLSNAIRASTDWNGVYFELFVFIGLMFFICCFSMSRYSIALEKKLQREHR
ncbi:amino acid ABC transporter permease [Mesobaculum littorinae]|uniref:Amino acid ABC transporter permease n=1 Tax=Mesobaculum littorinae TaxID=2486419 RepID=A0A438AER6_9RHOB|nr:amino acid ABC transporter permease [Mesobaculum littorinae]RVV97105.1 amino acid ABC transporter permease [Mesobaculum littorinae]